MVHLLGGVAIDVAAATINLGVRRLWFCDNDDNLVANFRWESIFGFTVRDSANGQAITDDLLHEKKKIEHLENTKGRILASIERVHQQVPQIASELNSTLVKI
jgi:hypothetical protein